MSKPAWTIAVQRPTVGAFAGRGTIWNVTATVTLHPPERLAIVNVDRPIVSTPKDESWYTAGEQVRNALSMQDAPRPLELALRAVGPTVSEPHERTATVAAHAPAAAITAAVRQATSTNLLILPLRHTVPACHNRRRRRRPLVGWTWAARSAGDHVEGS
jgi:hypothetical protein